MDDLARYPRRHHRAALEAMLKDIIPTLPADQLAGNNAGLYQHVRGGAVNATCSTKACSPRPLHRYECASDRRSSLLREHREYRFCFSLAALAHRGGVRPLSSWEALDVSASISAHEDSEREVHPVPHIAQNDQRARILQIFSVAAAA